MLVTLSYSAAEGGATELGHLLHKHPGKLQSFSVSVGKAHVFYPEAGDTRCTAALLLEVDPIALVRNKRFGGDAFSLGHYVNDRPYAASSMLAAAIGQVFRTAMTGRSDSHPQLAASAIALEIVVHAVPSRGGPELAERLFRPLGWTVGAEAVPLDPEFPEWGDSRYLTLRLSGSLRLADALHHLYVLLPVLDDSKHYWVSDDEVGKLLRAGDGWLAAHPERELITRRYLAHQRSYVADATALLLEGDDAPPIDEGEADAAPATPLNRLRADAVIEALREVGARRVIDLGCGPGALLARLEADPAFVEIIGTDVSHRSLEAAAKRLRLAEASDRQRERIRLLQSSVTYEDQRLAGFDAAVLMEVIEHIEPSRLPSVEDSVFARARPGAVVVTTPNAEYNTLYPSLPFGDRRHPDHRFEWTRDEFARWAGAVAERNGYTVEYRAVGELDAERGSPTQLALFRREVAR